MSYLDDFVDLVFPNTCAGCSNPLWKNEVLICPYCEYHLPATNLHLEKENTFTQLFWGRVRVESAAAFLFFNKGNTVQNLVHALKYKGRKEIGFWLGKKYGAALKQSSLFNTADFLLPVPLHMKKMISRGFNQSEQFAIGLSSEMGIPVESHVLFRRKPSETQTKKSRFLRWQNVEDIFDVRDYGCLEGKHVILVDDVVTTGATLESCIMALSGIPSVRVSLAAIAIASR